MSYSAQLLVRATLAAAVLLVGAVVQGRRRRSLEQPSRTRSDETDP